MRSTLRSFLPLAFLLACNGDGSDDEGLTREEAAALVVDALVTAGDPVVVLGMAEPLAGGDRIVAYHPVPEDVSEVAIEAESDAWFFWIDDEPGARFDHPSRFAIVDRSTGDITTVDARWWPLLDGAPVWDDAAYDSREDWVHFELPEGESSRSAFVPDLSPLADCTSSGGHAVVINGVEAGENGIDDFNKDGANMNDALTDAGLDTTYFGPPGAEGVDQTANEANLEAYFTAKAGELGPGDTLVVYLAGHGWNWDDGEYATGDTYISHYSETELQDWLGKFDPGVNIVVMIDGCHAGGMLDGLTCVADVAVSATDRDKSSWGDLDGEGETNPQDNGGEWTSSMLTCWSELMETEDSRADVAERAQAFGRSFFTELVSQCWERAPAYDLAHQRGKSSPQRAFGAAKAAIPQEDPEAPACNPGEPTPDAVCQDAELDIIAKTLGEILGAPQPGVCESTLELDEGNECLHSDGLKTSFADGEVDALLHYAASGISFEPPACGENVYCTDAPAEGSDTRYTVAAIEYASSLLQTGSSYYQYGFVFDKDGDTTNNYQAQDPYPADFYDGTDLWLQLQGGGGSPWRLTLTDVAAGYSAVPRFAQAIVDDDMIIIVMPSDLLLPGSGMRFTSFRHEGDYGVSGPWSGDVVPPVGAPLLPTPN